MTELHELLVEPVGERTSEGASGAGLVALGAAVAVAMQCLRSMFPIAYSYREEAGIARTVMVLLAVFALPAVAPVLARVARPGTVFLVAAGALALLRLSLQASSTITITLSAVASAVGLLAITSGVVAFRHHGANIAVAVVAGLGLDATIRGAWSTWDIVWQHGLLPWLVTIALVVVLVLAAARGRSDARESRGALALPGLVLGAYLALQVWFLQSPAFVASSAGVSLATAVFVVLVGDALALVLIAGWPRPRGGPAVALAGAAVAGLTGWWLPEASGAAVLALVGAQAFTSVLLAWSLTSTDPVRKRPTLRDTLGIAAGSLVFGAIVLLYQLHYDQPLPMSNRFLPAAAGALLAGVSLWARRSEPVAQTRVAALPLRVAGAIVVTALAVGAGLTLGEPDVRAARGPMQSLRVVTYNPHETVTRDGQLDPEAFARAVERLRADILVVEEAGRGWQLSAGLDLAEWAKRRLGLPYIWAPAADHQFGNLLFSRLPVLDARSVALPRGSGTMRRSAVVARVGPVDGTVVTVVGTHLQNGSSPGGHATRLAEIRVLQNALGTPRHTVIAGDLNADPGSPELRALLDAGFGTVQPSERCTLKTSNDNCSDWILVTPDLEQTSLHVLAFDAFDHRPVAARIRPVASR